jgi:mRNA interferase MazF
VARRDGGRIELLLSAAIEIFIRSYQNQDTQTAAGGAKVAINQGDIYWVQLGSDIPHPHVVLQENVFNHSRIATVVVCELTSNMKRVNMPGNVLLEAGEGNLPKQSVVEVSKVSSIEKAQLGDYIGSLTEERIHQILAGMRFLQQSFFAR